MPPMTSEKVIRRTEILAHTTALCLAAVFDQATVIAKLNELIKAQRR